MFKSTQTFDGNKIAIIIGGDRVSMLITHQPFEIADDQKITGNSIYLDRLNIDFLIAELLSARLLTWADAEPIDIGPDADKIIVFSKRMGELVATSQPDQSQR